MDAKIDLNEYAEFVDSVTSKESKQYSDFTSKLVLQDHMEDNATFQC